MKFCNLEVRVYIRDLRGSNQPCKCWQFLKSAERQPGGSRYQAFNTSKAFYYVVNALMSVPVYYNYVAQGLYDNLRTYLEYCMQGYVFLPVFKLLNKSFSSSVFTTFNCTFVINQERLATEKIKLQFHYNLR